MFGVLKLVSLDHRSGDLVSFISSAKIRNCHKSFPDERLQVHINKRRTHVDACRILVMKCMLTPWLKLTFRMVERSQLGCLTYSSHFQNV